MPVDIPKFDRCQELIDDFTIDWETNKPEYDVRGQLFLNKKSNYEISTPKDDLTSSQLAVIEYCKKYLPFTDYINIKIHHIQSTGMKMHIDFGDPEKNLELFKHTNEHEPCGFRMIVKGTKSGDMVVVVTNNRGEFRFEMKAPRRWRDKWQETCYSVDSEIHEVLDSLNDWIMDVEMMEMGEG